MSKKEQVLRHYVSCLPLKRSRQKRRLSQLSGFLTALQAKFVEDSIWVSIWWVSLLHTCSQLTSSLFHSLTYTFDLLLLDLLIYIPFSGCTIQCERFSLDRCKNVLNVVLSLKLSIQMCPCQTTKLIFFVNIKIDFHLESEACNGGYRAKPYLCLYAFSSIKHF